MDADKPVIVVNLSHVRFIGKPPNNKITGIIQGAWDVEASVAVITTVGVLMEEAFPDIGMNSRRAAVYLECDFEE